VTNLKPNHLDRHGTMEAYGAAKKNIFRFQKPTDVLVLNRDDEIVAAWAAEAPGRCEFFDGQGQPFELMLPGRHNQLNAQAAWAACRQLGLERAAAAEALRGFAGLPHRLQFVAERAGVRYFNDSKCTTPQGAVVALEAFEPRRAVMIVGGYDKHVGFESLGEALAQRAKAVVALGQTRGQIIAAVEASRQGAQPTMIAADDFDSAVAAACAQAAPGDAVLLSPACASWDMFQNYEQRGQRFIQLVAGNV
jgi:UDP-N-acetylmuramoylalanine--D-glutamate ligase